MEYQFVKINPSFEEWKLIESTYDSTCFHTQKWNSYLGKIGYKPFIVRVTKNEQILGFFVGERIWRGVWLIAAPFENVGTYTQGLCMLQPTDDESRIRIYMELSQWIFREKWAVYMQVEDWQMRRDYAEWIPNSEFHQEAIEAANVKYEVRPTLHVPINKSVEELWGGLHYKSAKYSVNKARKEGLYVKVIDRYNDISAFTKIHYDQLVEVCARKGMRPRPSQSRRRMQALCESLFPDRVIMMEVIGKDNDGKDQVMSSGIFCLDKGQCIYWTGASYQRYQKHCPNELMVWEAMKMMSERGCGDLNFGGIAPYKLKFGTIYAYESRMIFTKYEYVYRLKSLVKQSFYGIRNFVARIVGKRSFK